MIKEKSITFNNTKPYYFEITLLIHTISILIKYLVGLYGYSGEHDPPKFGDYEAQRHWMELTFNLKTKDWYTSSEYNPKEYWPLDYPPASGYYSYIWSFIFHLLLPDSLRLKSSWGYESSSHKLLMRLSVIASEILFFHLSVHLLLKRIFFKKDKMDHQGFYVATFMFLLSPLLIIIDNGHFQYNCVMHGLFIMAVYFLYTKKIIMAIISIVLCINFKQMGLYYTLPFPAYALRILFKDKGTSYKIKGLHILKYAIVTIVTQCVVWLPWILNSKTADVIERIFPLWRGIFEDKVATFWCTLNILYKINKLNQKLLLFASLLLTTGFSLFPLISILITKRKLKATTNLAFFIIATNFFLFSFHVHEKTILVPYLALLLNTETMSEIIPSFSLVGMFSLYPLLTRENQALPYFIMTFSFYIVARYITSSIIKTRSVNDKNITLRVISTFEVMIITFIIMYHITSNLVPPPKHFPWLYPTINAAVSFGYFMLSNLYANYKLIRLIRS